MAYRSGTPSVDNTTIKLQAAESLKKAAVAYKKLLDDDEAKAKNLKSQAGQSIKGAASGPDFPAALHHVVMANVQGAYLDGGGCCSSPSLAFQGTPKLQAADTSADIAKVFLTVTKSLGQKYGSCIHGLRDDVEESRNTLLKGLRENALALVRAQKSFEGADAAERNSALSGYRQRLTEAKTEERVQDMMAAAGNDYMKSDQAMLNKYAGGTGRQSVEQEIRTEQAYAGELVGGQAPVLAEAKAVAEAAQAAADKEEQTIKDVSKEVTNRARAYFHLGDKGTDFKADFFVSGFDGAGLEFSGETSADIIECYETVHRMWIKADVNSKTGGADLFGNVEGAAEWEAAAKDCYNLLITAATAIAKVLINYKKLEMTKLAMSISGFLEAYKAGADGAAAQTSDDKTAGRGEARQEMAANAQFGKAMAGVLNKEDERHTGALHQATTS